MMTSQEHKNRESRQLTQALLDAVGAVARALEISSNQQAEAKRARLLDLGRGITAELPRVLDQFFTVSV